MKGFVVYAGEWVMVLDSWSMFQAWFYFLYFLLGQKMTGPLVIMFWEMLLKAQIFKCAHFNSTCSRVLTFENVCQDLVRYMMTYVSVLFCFTHALDVIVPTEHSAKNPQT